jgi:hypothetical protein
VLGKIGLSLKIETGSATLAQEVLAGLEADARSTFALLDALREGASIPESDTVLVFADDFVTTVRDNMRFEGDEGYGS